MSVKGVLGHYYKTDAEVCQDSELQKWIQDFFEHDFLSQACTALLKDKLVFIIQEIHIFDEHYSAEYIIWTEASFLINLNVLILVGFFFYSSGMPQNFCTVAELVKFVTMVIFTCSGQQLAVGSGRVHHYHLL